MVHLELYGLHRTLQNFYLRIRKLESRYGEHNFSHRDNNVLRKEPEHMNRVRLRNCMEPKGIGMVMESRTVNIRVILSNTQDVVPTSGNLNLPKPDLRGFCN